MVRCESEWLRYRLVASLQLTALTCCSLLLLKNKPVVCFSYFPWDRIWISDVSVLSGLFTASGHQLAREGCPILSPQLGSQSLSQMLQPLLTPAFSLVRASCLLLWKFLAQADLCVCDKDLNFGMSQQSCGTVIYKYDQNIKLNCEIS